LFLLSI